MTDMQRIRAEALWVAVEMFGHGRDVGYVLHVADDYFVPYILTGSRDGRKQTEEDE